MSSLSPEVRNAPYDLHRLIIEQQYSEAVKLIVNMRAYHRDRLNATVTNTGGGNEKSPSRGEGSASLLALGVLMKRIEASCGQLAETLMASMAEALPGVWSCLICLQHIYRITQYTLLRHPVNPLSQQAHTVDKQSLQLPPTLSANSPLWGPAELRSRLHLLIQLGRVDLAARGYLSSQAVVLARVVSAAVADIGTITSSGAGGGSSDNRGGGQDGGSPRGTSVTDGRNVRGGVRSNVSGSNFSSSSSGGGSGSGSRGSGTTLPPNESTQTTTMHASTTDHLCRAFTTALFDSCSSFLVLFKAQQALDPGIASTLLLWTQNQVCQSILS